MKKQRTIIEQLRRAEKREQIAVENLDTKAFYAFMLHQLSVYFSKNIDSSLSHMEFMDFWTKQAASAFTDGRRGLLTSHNQVIQIIDLIPHKKGGTK